MMPWPASPAATPAPIRWPRPTAARSTIDWPFPFASSSSGFPGPQLQSLLHLAKKPGNAAAKPALALSLCREKLAQEVLIEGSKLLSIRRTANAESDLDEVRSIIYDAIRARFKMKNTPPADLDAKLQATIARSLELLIAMGTARPASCLLVPAQRTAFTPDLHEAIVGCPDQAGASVQLTVFPGYLVTGSNRVLEKALVYTE